jgi:hypothetical protein
MTISQHPYAGVPEISADSWSVNIIFTVLGHSTQPQIFYTYFWDSADHSGRSNIGVVGSNPTRDMNVFVYSGFVLPCVGSGLAAGGPPPIESYRLSI